MTSDTKQILVSLGVNPENKTPVPDLHDHWTAFSFKNEQGRSTPCPILLIDSGPKNMADAKKILTKFPACVVLLHVGSSYAIFLKSGEQSMMFKLENTGSYEQIISILNTADFAGIENKMKMIRAIQKLIESIPTHTADFDNRGVFSTHYLKNRLFQDIKYDIKKQVDKISCSQLSTYEILRQLGWKIKDNGPGIYKINSIISIIVSDAQDLGTKTNYGVAPSYIAVSELKNSKWIILTNGIRWRLYTSRVSATTTNYFEINLGLSKILIFEYLAALFSALAYKEIKSKTAIDIAFDEGKTYSKELEEDLATKILTADGIFLDLVKGVLDHDMKRKFQSNELESAKDNALRIMYRVWFLLYAESRDLLPVKDDRYKSISLQLLRTKLDSMDTLPDEHTCWDSLLNLFEGIRNGSVKNNLPQYNGGLFKQSSMIDSIKIKNKFIVPALRGLFEKDGEPMDYASLGVRHLGNIYESLMEFSVKQAETDIMLLEDAAGIREVETSKDSTYSYKKNDLYLASKGGIASRKSAAAYYTPEEIVRFLVGQALAPIFKARQKVVKDDIIRYRKDRSDENRRTCIDRLLDIQVLDPSMGSGHFLVEALNRITSWIAEILEKHEDHPLIAEIDSDLHEILRSQKERGITLDERLLTDDVLLKRKIMKRCMFGVDVNPLAVELAKLSLWLDSFAIGVPLTYMDHHLKTGDSTIGMWRKDLVDKNQTLDSWMDDTNKVGDHMTKVSCNSDITIDQVQTSEDEHDLYEKQMAPHKIMLDVLASSKINSGIIPKNAARDVRGYVKRFGGSINSDAITNDMMDARTKVNALSESYRFFHWELEMMDAFTDKRRGFDVIIGNPPWNKVKPNNDEFFPPYYPGFRSLKPNTKKKEKIKELLKDPIIRQTYEKYVKSFKGRNSFYKTTRLQGTGDKDLWQLILERSFNLVADGGIISMVIPSQILANAGSREMRKILLEKDILSLYVFENKKKIFDIHSSYRFTLLTISNKDGPDKFPAGFYLHDLTTLDGGTSEKDKLFTVSKNVIKKTSPDDFMIPERGGKDSELLTKLATNKIIGLGLSESWTFHTSRCFDATLDSHLFKNDGKGWNVLSGAHIHQFMHDYRNPEYTTDKLDGLRHESSKRVYIGQHEHIYNSYRLVFRNISSPTNMRTAISAIMPPHTFHTNALYSVILQKNGQITLDSSYYKKVVYLCGIFNSMTFDFVARSKIQTNLATVISSIPIPKKSKFDDEITLTSAKLCVGTKEFAGLAESLRIDNHLMTPSERIDNLARLDAMVAHAYQLTEMEYKLVLDSFKLGEDPNMAKAKSVDWSGDRKTMKNFFGEVRKLAMPYYKELER